MSKSVIRNLQLVGLVSIALFLSSSCDTAMDDNQFGQTRGLLSDVAVLDVGHPDAIPNEYIVTFKSGVTTASAASTMRDIAALGASILSELPIIRGFSCQLTASHITILRTNPNIKYIEANKLIKANTEYLNPPYGLDRVDQRAGADSKYNDFNYDGSGVHAYIIDTGIKTSHNEFSGRIGDGFSSIMGTSEDCNGHGTHVASTVGGTKFGLAKKVTLHPVRVLNCIGRGSDATVIAGLQWVSTNVAKNPFPSVVNMSLGGPRSEALNDAVRALTDRQIVVVVAAGNDYAMDACGVSPASAPSALTVAATDSADSRADFSNIGPCVDLFAPGDDVLGAGIGSDSAAIRLSGTSMASPHVAGAIAQYLQRYPRLTVNQVNVAILFSSTPGRVTDPRSSNQFLYTNFGRPAGNLCYGRCGGQSPDFSCGCDTFCAVLGDCCTDFMTACT